jgi:nicotinamide mononucleotide transporter
LLFHKNLPLFGLLTLFLFVIAIWGYFEWRAIYHKENDQAFQS